MEEIWKDIKDYEDIYQVSNLGNVKSKTRVVNRKYQGQIIPQIVYGQEMSFVIHKKGYLRVWLAKNGKRKSYMVHRLVAEAFIPNVDNKPEVNHIDGNKQNNSVDNLEWVTGSENVVHSFEVLKRKHFLGKENWASKEVIQYNLNMNEVARYGSTYEAGKINSIQGKSIARCCRNERKTYKNFIWKYAEN